MDKVSICIPVIRPESAKKCFESVHLNAGIARSDYEFVTEEDKDRIGCPKMLKRLVDRSQYPLVMFLGDDTLMLPNCLKNAIAAMQKLPDGWGLIGINDQTNRPLLATHWLASKKLLPLLDGEFFHTGYMHTACDNELTDRCVEAGRYAWAVDAVIEHVHPMLRQTVPSDDDYKRVYSLPIRDYDKRLYWHRKQSGWKTTKEIKMFQEASPKSKEHRA